MFYLIAFSITAILALILGYLAYRLGLITRTNNVYLLISHALLLFSLFLIFSSASRFELYREQTAWPVVTGFVDHAEVVGERAVRPQIYYSYRYEGSSFADSTNLGTPGFGGRNSRRSTARNITGEYSPGDTLQVHVNPQNPKESYLRIIPGWNIFMQYGLGIVFAGISAGFIGCAVAQRRSVKKVHKDSNGIT